MERDVMRGKVWFPDRMRHVFNVCQGASTEPDEPCPICVSLQTINGMDRWLLGGDHCVVTHSPYPYSPGHLLIIPRRHVCTLKDLLDRESLEIMQTLQRCQEVLEYVVQPHDYDIGITAGKIRNTYPAQHLVYQIVPRKKYDKNLMQIVSTRTELHAILKGTYKDLKSAFQECKVTL